MSVKYVIIRMDMNAEYLIAGPFDTQDEAFDYRAYIREYSDLDGLHIIPIDDESTTP